MRITILCGGLGGARLALALKAAGRDGEATFVTNVGDDWEVGGLLVCPDTDAVLYALAGIFDEERGWGIHGDRFDGAPLGGLDWFHVGVRDRSQHQRRTELMGAGLSLTEVTAVLAGGLGLRACVLPATDARVRTRIRTPAGVLAWQEWLVREEARPPVAAVTYAGIEAAQPTDAVLRAIRAADLAVLAASSPVASLAPILALAGVTEAIRARRLPTVAISPVVRRLPAVAARDRRRAAARAALLASRGMAHDPVGIAALYADLVDAYVLDDADAADAAAVRDLGLRVVVAPTLDRSAGPRLLAALARELT